MKTERLISCFDKITEVLVNEINVDDIEIEKLKAIFSPPSEDPLLYYSYKISSREAELLKVYVNINFDFKRFVYQLDCFQV